MNKNSFLYTFCICLLFGSMQACEPMENSATLPAQKNPDPLPGPDKASPEMDEAPGHLEDPKPYRPPDLSHITDARKRVTAQLEAFDEAMSHSLNKNQKTSVFAKLEPKVLELLEQVERSGAKKPHRSLMKLDMAESLLPREHALHEKIARLRQKIGGAPEISKTKDHADQKTQDRKGQESLANYLHTRGQKALKTKNLPQAAWAFREALKYNADHQGAKTGLRNLEIEAKKLYEIAYVTQKNSPQKSMARLRQVIEITDPGNRYHSKSLKLWRKLNNQALPPPPRGRPAPVASDQQNASSSARAQGITLHKQKRYGEAIAKYKQARIENPKDAEVLRLLGTAYAMQGNPPQAYLYYKKYVEQCPRCMHAPGVRKILKDYGARAN